MREYKVKTFKAISEIIPGLAQKALKDNGSVKMRLLTQWASIVGNDISTKALPREVRFSRSEPPVGTLELEVTGGFATEIGMLEPVILEKIATYFGYRAIGRIRLLQAPKD